MSIEIRKPLKFTGQKLQRGQTLKACKEFLSTATKDRYLLLRIAVDGPIRFRNIASKAFRGFLVTEKMLDGMYDFLVAQAGPEPRQQLDALERADLVALKLDRLKGLARFIESERHLDEVLERHLPDTSERTAIRQQMLLMLKSSGVVH